MRTQGSLASRVILGFAPHPQHTIFWAYLASHVGYYQGFASKFVELTDPAMDVHGRLHAQATGKSEGSTAAMSMLEECSSRHEHGQALLPLGAGISEHAPGALHLLGGLDL